jgi:hypothetical protein
MLNREDLLELTRRMTPKRNCFTRIAGGYMDAEGYIDDSFNVHFQKLKADETGKMLQIMKTIPFSETNKNLKAHPFPAEGRAGKFRQLLTALIQCELKNDALLDTLYELIGEKYKAAGDYAILVCQGNYDIPLKGSDKERQDESEEVYRFLILAVCPQIGSYEPGEPEWGFLYPSFSDRSEDRERIAVYRRDAGRSHPELMELLGESD